MDIPYMHHNQHSHNFTLKMRAKMQQLRYLHQAQMNSKDNEVFKDLEEKYEKVRKLLEEDAKRDPETEPYRSKYLASSLLKDMKCILDKVLDDVNAECQDYLRYKAMLGAVNLNLGIIAVDTEELSTGEEHLTNCVDGLSEYSTKQECIIVTLTALNQLGILWSQRDDPKKSQAYLEKAEVLYKTYINSENAHNSSSESESSLEQVHTLTLYYLAQIYSSLNDHVKAAVYCHTTLRRQLESKNFDPIDWALNAATLSQYFLEKNGYSQARHHLAAASYILDQYENEGNLSVGTEEEQEAKKEQYHHRCADVSRCWAKYSLTLLAASKERLMAGTDEDGLSNNLAEMQVSENSLASQQEVSELWFISLELSTYEEGVDTRYALVFEEARELFRHSRNWLSNAQTYYTKESHASDYVQIVQDMSQLYKNLIFFEDDKERQCRMHKRRIVLLEDVLKELNPQYYLLVCRQLWFELAETYSDMLEIKLTRVQETNDQQQQNAIQRKVHQLAEKSIANFKTFLESLKGTHSKKIPDPLGDDVMRPALIAHFYLGRLYGQLPTPDGKTYHSLLKNE
ncbi:KIF1-binding protein [Gryllus bimaculatus]|nr:KIF1-binding protein [Gryllus bimaculatus]